MSFNDAMEDPTDSSDKPVIFTFTFGSDWQQSMFQSLHSRFLNILFERSIFRHARTAQQALALFAKYGQPRAVFVADSAIMKAKNEVVSQKLVQYATGGGTVVFGGLFSADLNHENLDRFFGNTWDLPWEAGSRHRTTLTLNRAAVEPPLRDELQVSYSQEALFLQGVEYSEAWYLPSKGSVVESFVPLPGPIIDFAETPVVFAQFGNGWVGYVGDVNAEEGTDAAALGMMGLLV